MTQLSKTHRTFFYIFAFVLMGGGLAYFLVPLLTMTLEDADAQSSSIIRINSGSNSEYIDQNGNRWLADLYFDGGSVATRDTATRSDDGFEGIFLSERWGLNGYNIPVSNGLYLVSLHFSETFTGINGAGQRTFGIEAEGQDVIQQVDVYGETGGNFIGLERQFAVTVSDGTLNIEFISGQQNPMINGLEVIPAISRQYFPFVGQNGTIEVPETSPQPVPTSPAPANDPVIEPVGDPDYVLNPGNINSQWPSVAAGDIIFLNPGTYSGGDIRLSVNASADNPVIIRKTPGTSGKVIFDGGYDHNTLFQITGSHIQIGGTQVMSGWEPDFVIREYDFAGIRLYRDANDIRLHHIEYLDNGTNFNGFGVRVNGQNVTIEYSRFEDNAADAIQAETGSGGTDIENLTIRYNYGYNRLANGQQWAWNAAAHTDFLQVQRGSAVGIEIYGNMIVGFTNALLLGDSWGSVTDVTVRDNFILFEANGVSSSSKGDTSGNYIIENNHLVIYQVDGVDGGGRSAILLKDRGDSESASIRCNIFYGVVDSTNANIDSSVNRSSEYNIETGNTSSFDEISTTEVNLGYSMSNARDLSGIYTLTSPQAGAGCTQGASFTSVGEHLLKITQ